MHSLQATQVRTLKCKNVLVQSQIDVCVNNQQRAVWIVGELQMRGLGYIFGWKPEDRELMR